MRWIFHLKNLFLKIGTDFKTKYFLFQKIFRAKKIYPKMMLGQKNSIPNPLKWNNALDVEMEFFIPKSLICVCFLAPSFFFNNCVLSLFLSSTIFLHKLVIFLLILIFYKWKIINFFTYGFFSNFYLLKLLMNICWFCSIDMEE